MISLRLPGNFAVDRLGNDWIGFRQRKIHLSGRIFEHPQTDNLIPQPINFGVAIVVSNPQQHDEPAANPPGFRAVINSRYDRPRT